MSDALDPRRSPQLDAGMIAAEVLLALDSCGQVQPFTARYPEFDLDRAYAVTAELRRLRMRRGERPIGRKLGFTNKAAWAGFNINAPIWGDIYETTVHELIDDETFVLPQLRELRIEPEIVFQLARPVSLDLDDRALLAAIEWVAHGFEIVHSIFPDWRFQAADAVAGAGVHGALLIGPRRPVDAWEVFDLVHELAGFSVALVRDGAVVDRGGGAHVLGSPLSALRYLVDALAHDRVNPALGAGEIVTTGTLTRAFPVGAGQRWTTLLEGIGLRGLAVRLA